MSRILLAVLVVAIMGGVGATLSLLPAAAQNGPSATRSFDPATVEPGGEVTVTITASNYGQLGGVTETLPAGFTYVSSDLSDSQVNTDTDGMVRFTLQGDSSFTYIVTASSIEGGHDFSGTLRDDDRMDHIGRRPFHGNGRGFYASGARCSQRHPVL